MSQPQRLLILFRIKRGAVEVLKFARVLGSSVSLIQYINLKMGV